MANMKPSWNWKNSILSKEIPKKCRQLVREWAELHQDELLEMWDNQNFHPIAPLE
jgi:hypothetical protein